MHQKTQSNKQGWDALADIHFKNYDIDRLLSGKPLLNEVIRKEVGNVQGKSLVHLLCHIGTDTLSWALLGAEVTGIDISPKSLYYARQLAERMEIEADFIESDILDVIDNVSEKFDIAFCSTGVLCWIPDIKRFAQTVCHLLKPGGFFYIHDGHPCRNVMLDEQGEFQFGQIIGDYFRKQVWSFDAMGDYTDTEFLTPTPSYEWNWTLGEVVTAMCEAGLRIEFLHEYPQFFYGGYTAYDVEDNKVELYPCTFSLKATAIVRDDERK